jgi:hypothetical protein
MSYLKIDLYRDFAACVYLSEAQNPIPPPPQHTLYKCTQYTYSHREGGGRRRGELTREKDGSKIPT